MSGGYGGEPSTPDAPERGRRRTPLVLIVDDNVLNLKLARDVLRAAGFRTLEAASGAEAIALAVEPAARTSSSSTSGCPTWTASPWRASSGRGRRPPGSPSSR